MSAQENILPFSTVEETPAVYVQDGDTEIKGKLQEQSIIYIHSQYIYRMYTIFILLVHF